MSKDLKPAQFERRDACLSLRVERLASPETPKGSSGLGTLKILLILVVLLFILFLGSFLF
jgi:hypothetical protein